MKIIISENQLNTITTNITEAYLEGNYAPLYHSSANIAEILTTDYLKTGNPLVGAKAICLSRNSSYECDNRDWPRLKLDQNKLRIDGFIPKPIDEFGDKSNSQNRKFVHKFVYEPNTPDEDFWKNIEWESEERVYEDIPNLHKYIIAIQIPPAPNTKKPEELPYLGKIKEYIKKYPYIKLESFDLNKRWNISQIEEEKDINELFDTDLSYPFKLIETKKYQDAISYRYEFITKDDVTYFIILRVNSKSRKGSIDFSTTDKEKNYSFIHLINKHDAIKVFNTLKKIIQTQTNNIDYLILHSRPERLEFYKKIFDHLNYQTQYVDPYLKINLHPENTPI